MIQDQIDELIKSAMKNSQSGALRVYRAVKTAFMEYRTAKNAKPLDEAAEINIIRKMISAREDAMQQFKDAGRTELAEAEAEEITYLNLLKYQRKIYEYMPNLL